MLSKNTHVDLKPVKNARTLTTLHLDFASGLFRRIYIHAVEDSTCGLAGMKLGMENASSSVGECRGTTTESVRDVN